MSGLLQLANQIIFSDKIKLCSYESPAVLNHSVAVRDTLLSLGVSKAVIEFHNFDRSQYALACNRVSKRIYDDLQYTSIEKSEPNRSLLKIAHPDLPSIMSDVIEQVHHLITDDISERERTDLATHALDSMAAGADVYIIASCPSLLGLLKQHASSLDWTLQHTEELQIYLRYYLNEELAKLSNADYCPAVGRARITNKHNSLILKSISEVNDVIASAVKTLEPSRTGIPSIAEAVVKHAMGEPRSIIEVAIAFREKAKPFRRHLQSIMSPGKSSGYEDLHNVRMATRHLGQVLLNDLGLKPAPRIRDAFEVQFLGLVPIPSITKLLDWIEYRIERRRISFMSEFAKIAADQRLDFNTFSRLHRKCCATAS